jgi:glutamate-1-semialdehyde 2,1-aminomutase
LLGHSPGTIRAAATDAIDRGWSYGSVHGDEVRLAEVIAHRFESIERVRFTNSGTEANLMAIGLAIHHTGRQRVIVFRNGYHGGVLTFDTEPSPIDVPHDWVLCDYNDTDSVDAAFTDGGGAIAAVLVEPMQGSGGCIPAAPGFLAHLRDACDRAGALLIFDEVMISRFSTGGAQAIAGVRPDLTTLGKYLAGGFTFGAFGGSADVMSHFDPDAAECSDMRGPSTTTSCRWRPESQLQRCSAQKCSPTPIDAVNASARHSTGCSDPRRCRCVSPGRAR